MLKLRGDAAPGALAGGVENLLTGPQREFASADELLAAIVDHLAGAEPPPAAES